MEKKTKDLVFSFVLAILGIYVFVGGLSVYRKAALPPYNITEFTVSPGFLPTVLGALLFVFSVVFALGLLKSERGMKTELIERMKEAGIGLKNSVTDKENLYTALGVVLMAIYSFLLVEFLPFWASSLIFLVALFLYLRAGKWWKSIIVAVAAIVLIIIVFQYCFNAALP